MTHAIFMAMFLQFAFFASFLITYTYMRSRNDIEKTEIEELKNGIFEQVESALNHYINNEGIIK